jgi:hypothetical protein
MAGVRRLSWRLCAAGFWTVLLAGCQTLPSLTPCPLGSVEQAARIQEIVPLGTPREEAVAKLKKAGVEGTFSEGNSIYYCGTWAQNDKERWHIHVEMLFDGDGKVYAFRPDPQHVAVRQEEPGVTKIAKKPKEVAAGPKSSVVDPFME